MKQTRQLVFASLIINSTLAAKSMENDSLLIAHHCENHDTE